MAVGWLAIRLAWSRPVNCLSRVVLQLLLVVLLLLQLVDVLVEVVSKPFGLDLCLLPGPVGLGVVDAVELLVQI